MGLHKTKLRLLCFGPHTTGHSSFRLFWVAEDNHFRRTFIDLEKWGKVEHKKTGLITPDSNVFDTEATCVLALVITDGPCYQCMG
jgi:hypothetical protein